MATPIPAAAPSVAAWVEGLQAAGRYTFTRADVARLDGRTAVAADAALRRLKQRGRIQSPRRGFLVIVPVEYRAAGCPPASWFVADLMRFLGQPYYTGILTAAALHGAAHQQPMAFQVVTDRPTRPAVAGRVRISFHMSRIVRETPVVELPTETGTMRVASPEATAFDLVRYPAAAGHFGNVATVLGELAERMDGARFLRCAQAQAAPDVQRLGHLLQRLGQHALADSLWESLVDVRLRPVLLAAGRARGRGRLDPRWRVVANVRVEADG